MIDPSIWNLLWRFDLGLSLPSSLFLDITIERQSVIFWLWKLLPFTDSLARCGKSGIPLKVWMKVWTLIWPASKNTVVPTTSKRVSLLWINISHSQRLLFFYLFHMSARTCTLYISVTLYCQLSPFDGCLETGIYRVYCCYIFACSTWGVLWFYHCRLA